MPFISKLKASFLLQRIIAAVFVFFTGLLAAKILGTEFFGILYLTVYGGKILSLLSFGIQSGFLHQFYLTNAPKGASDSKFLLSYSAHLVFISILLLLFVVFFGFHKYTYPVIYFIILIPIYLIEPIARTKRVFFVSILPDVIGAASVLTLLIFAQSVDFVYWHLIFIIASLFFSIISTVFFVKLCKISYISPAKHTFKYWFKYYFSLLNSGMPLYVGTGLYLLYSAIDRIFIEEYFSNADLSMYTLSFQLASASTLILSALNFTGSINFGERINDRSSLQLLCTSNLKKSSVWAVFGVLFATLSAKILGFFLEDYNGTVLCTFALSIGLAIFFVSGSITPVLFYLNKTVFLNYNLFFVAIVAIIADYILILNFDSPLLIVFANSALLVIYSAVCVIYTFHGVKAYVRQILNE